MKNVARVETCKIVHTVFLNVPCPSTITMANVMRAVMVVLMDARDLEGVLVLWHVISVLWSLFQMDRQILNIVYLPTVSVLLDIMHSSPEMIPEGDIRWVSCWILRTVHQGWHRKEISGECPAGYYAQFTRDDTGRRSGECPAGYYAQFTRDDTGRRYQVINGVVVLCLINL